MHATLCVLSIRLIVQLLYKCAKSVVVTVAVEPLPHKVYGTDCTQLGE